jgi:hypothetical protein
VRDLRGAVGRHGAPPRSAHLWIVAGAVLPPCIITRAELSGGPGENGILDAEDWTAAPVGGTLQGVTPASSAEPRRIGLRGSRPKRPTPWNTSRGGTESVPRGEAQDLMPEEAEQY